MGIISIAVAQGSGSRKKYIRLSIIVIELKGGLQRCDWNRGKKMTKCLFDRRPRCILLSGAFQAR